MRRFLVLVPLLAAVGGSTVLAASTDPLPAGRPEPQAAILFLGVTGGAIEPCL